MLPIPGSSNISPIFRSCFFLISMVHTPQNCTFKYAGRYKAGMAGRELFPLFVFLWLQIFSPIGRIPCSVIPSHSSLFIFIVVPTRICMCLIYVLVVLSRTQNRKQHSKGFKWREWSELATYSGKVRVKDINGATALAVMRSHSVSVIYCCGTS